MDEKKTIIKVENLFFKYPDEEEYIINDVSIEFYKGEFALITGPRGEGKSTFLKIIAGILLPETGNVFYDGINLNGATKKQLIKIHQKTGFVFQDSALISNMNIFDNVALPLRYNELLNENEILKKVEQMLKYINMEEYKNYLPAFISMGQKKMVALIRALITEPETIFYDEPIANLDKDSRDIILNLMLETNKKGVTTIVVSHEIEEFEPYYDRLIEFKNRTISNIKTQLK